jgi:hypothetical protein
MRKKAKTVLGAFAVVMVIAFFLLAPVVYWKNVSPANGGFLPIYRSLGCATIGVGAAYGTGVIGYQLSCNPQYGPFI